MDEKVSLAEPRTWMDSLGTTVSVACAIQCTLFPLLIGVLPLLGLGFLAGDGIEKVFIVTSIVLAAASFSWGFRHHRRFYIFLFLVSGLALIFTGRVWVADGFEIPVVVSGTLVLTSGHLLDRRLCRLCVACEHREEQKSKVPHDSF
jgi:MerC mercury resistance protein